MEDARLGRHRGRTPSDEDWLDHHHGDRYIPRHGLARHIPRSLPRELAITLAVMAADLDPSG